MDLKKVEVLKDLISSFLQTMHGIAHPTELGKGRGLL
jgi:hypothetical protein